MTFDKLGLQSELLQAITSMGFTTPTPIQEAAIPLLIAQKTDMIGLAETGSGKTGAFSLPLLQQIDLELKLPQGLILCPTRELCTQTVREIRHFAMNLTGLRVLAIYGGASISYQINELRRGAQLIVATPGRLIDIIERGVIDFSNTKVAILDEADEMLDMGFKDDLEQILQQLPEQRQTWMFSATMRRDVAEIAKNHLHEPVEITIGAPNRAASNIQHVSFVVNQPHRYAALRRLIDITPDIFGLIFCRTRRDTQELADKLANDGYHAEPLHGDLSQAQRDQVMQRFRQQKVRLLIATDVAARGIDVDDITHIIHYQLPDDLDIYTHRSGRTARAGKSGYSFAFATPAERYRLKQIERRLQIRFSEQQIPDGLAVCHQLMLKMSAELTNATADDEKLAFLYPLVEAELSEISREDLIKQLIAVELKRVSSSHLSNHNLNADSPAARRSDNRERNRQSPQRERWDEQSNMQTFEVNVGHNHNVNAGAIVRMVCQYGDIESSQIGSIRITPFSSLFEVPRPLAGQIRQGMRQAELDGNPVEIRDAAPGSAARKPPSRRPPPRGGQRPPFRKGDTRTPPAGRSSRFPRKREPYQPGAKRESSFKPRFPHSPHHKRGGRRNFTDE